MTTEPVKPPRRMACWNCPRYCRTERRCRDGKSNPRRKSDSIAVAEALGLRALCHYNTHRDALALRMFFPLDPFTVQASARSRKRARRSAEPLVGPPPERAEAVRDPE